MKLNKLLLCLAGAALAVPFTFGIASRISAADNAPASETNLQATVTIDATNFPDATFRDIVKSFDLDNSGTLSDEEIEKIDFIECNEKGITSLAGVEYLKSLTYLDCSGNKLTELDVTALRKLETLRCGSNQIKRLNCSRNTALVELECSGGWLNQSGQATSYGTLTYVSVSGLKKLEYLDVSGNQLKGLDVSKNPSLLSLNCVSNKLSSLDVSNLASLSELNVSFNQIKSIDLSNNPELSSLICSHDPITSLDISNNRKLEILECESTGIPSLDLSEHYLLTTVLTDGCSLETLDIGDTRIADYFDPDLVEKVNEDDDPYFQFYYRGDDPSSTLYYLTYDLKTDLKYEKHEKFVCQIDTKNFPDDNFRKYVSQFDINKDQAFSVAEIANIRTIELSPETSGSIESCKGIEFFSDLVKLSITNKDITSLRLGDKPDLVFLQIENENDPDTGAPRSILEQVDISGCPNLITFISRDNPIQSINLSKNTKLEELQLYNADLVRIDLSSNKNLISLNVNGNKNLTALNVSKCTKLLELYCDNTSIKGLDLYSNTELTSLSCYKNSIKSLELRRNPKLRYLDISGNSIGILDISPCTDLREFNCSSNPIQRLNISKNNKIEILECAETRISQLNLGNVNLTKLNLSLSKVKKVDVTKQTNLQELDLVGLGLKQLNLTNNKKLLHLEVQDNFLSDLALQGMEDLNYLDIRLNLFTSIPKNSCSGEVLAEPQKAAAVPENLHVESRSNSKITLVWDDAPGIALPDGFEIYRSEDSVTGFDMIGKSTKPKYVDGKVDPNKTYYYFVVSVRDLTEYGMGFYRYSSETIEVSTGYVPTPTKGTTGTPTKEPTKAPISDPTFEDFVERLYTVALNRESDPEGKAFWVKQVVEEGKTGADCARFFLLDADEFMRRNLTVEDFVETLYKTFFDRESDAAGKKGWVSAISSGRKSRTEVVNDFIESTEWCDVCATYGVKAGAKYHKATKASRNAINFATRLYTCCLKRDAEDGGLKYWSLALTNLEKTGAEAAQFFFESDEFIGYKTSDKEYLLRLYTTFMDREPAADEVSFWIGEIAGGRQSRHSILAFFAQSPEFTRICKQYGIDRGTIA